jgi:hypothetical protein
MISSQSLGDAGLGDAGLGDAALDDVHDHAESPIAGWRNSAAERYHRLSVRPSSHRQHVSKRVEHPDRHIQRPRRWQQR